MPSSRIDRYSPEELLGSAGLVDTFRVSIKGENGLAGLKLLFLDRGKESTTRLAAERLLEAGRHAMACPAPGIARILEVSDNPRTPFVATEYVLGFDLARLIQLTRKSNDARVGGLSPALAGQICAHVAGVLARAHAHEPPLFHLGLCPGNVVVTPTATVTVLDFGLAASFRGVGICPLEKWHFVAPELLEVDATTISAEAARVADFYSLGVLLHFLLAGRAPFPASTLAELAARKHEPLAFPSGVPANILAAGRAMTAPDPRDRPASIQQVNERLSEGVDSSRGSSMVQALHALGLATVQSSNTDGPAPLARPDTRPGASATLASSTARIRQTGQGAHRGGLGSFPWRSRVLLATGAILLLGLLVARTAAFCGFRESTKSRNADSPIKPGNLARGHVELGLPQGRDAGLVLGDPEYPAPGHGYLPDPGQTPSRVPNRLFLDTSPSRADVWVDGIFKGTTPVDLAVGPGGHRVVAIKPGYLMLRTVYDTTLGEYARRELQPATAPTFGEAFLDIQCPTPNKYPVILDDEETGLLCPVGRLPVRAGKHTVAIFVPQKRTNLSVEIDVPPGRQPIRVSLKE